MKQAWDNTSQVYSESWGPSGSDFDSSYTVINKTVYYYKSDLTPQCSQEPTADDFNTILF